MAKSPFYPCRYQDDIEIVESYGTIYTVIIQEKDRFDNMKNIEIFYICGAIGAFGSP